MKNVKCKVLKLISCLALTMTVISVNQTCMYWIYQSKIPESAKKYRRF